MLWARDQSQEQLILIRNLRVIIKEWVLFLDMVLQLIIKWQHWLLKHQLIFRVNLTNNRLLTVTQIPLVKAEADSISQTAESSSHKLQILQLIMDQQVLKLGKIRKHVTIKLFCAMICFKERKYRYQTRIHTRTLYQRSMLYWVKQLRRRVEKMIRS